MGITKKCRRRKQLCSSIIRSLSKAEQKRRKDGSGVGRESPDKKEVDDDNNSFRNVDDAEDGLQGKK